MRSASRSQRVSSRSWAPWRSSPGRLRVRTCTFCRPARTAIVVLDLSASVSQDTYSRIGETLGGCRGVRRTVRGRRVLRHGVRGAAARDAAAALKPLVRCSTLPDQSTPGLVPTFPVNPWSRTFSGGTRISSGLELARQLALDTRRHKPGVIVLVSDAMPQRPPARRAEADRLSPRRDPAPERWPESRRRPMRSTSGGRSAPHGDQGCAATPGGAEPPQTRWDPLRRSAAWRSRSLPRSQSTSSWSPGRRGASR